MSFWSLICCCLRTEEENTDALDEQTRLLQPAEDLESASRPRTAADQERMKERFGTIVRSKEGKMVSVNAPLPFNMHNKAIHRLPSSTSNSQSPSHPHGTNGGARYPSPHPSIDTDITPSESTGEDGMGPGISGLAGGSMQRGPQLGLRLVNGSGTRRASGSRGRGKRSTAWNGGMDSEERTEEVQDDEAVGDETPGEPISPSSNADKHVSEPNEDSEPKPSFALRVGSISRSWGDT